jgi:hypothetical protein
MITHTVDIAPVEATTKRGRPHKDWTARSMLAMPLPLAFVQHIIERPIRDADVIGRWLGTYGRREPLKEIAERYNVTSERCRQIVKRFGHDVLGGEEGIEKFLHICRDETVDGPVSFEQLRMHKELIGISTVPMIVVHMLDIIKMIHPLKDIPEISRDHSGIVLLPTDKTTWERAQVIAGRMVRLAGAESARERVAEMLPNLSVKHRDYLIDAARSSSSVRAMGDVREAIRILLEDSPEPVTTTDIARRMQEITGVVPDYKYVRNTAAAVGVKIGRSLFTSEKNIGISKQESDIIQGLVLDIMKREPADTLWRPSEFLLAISEALPELRSLNAEILHHILGGNDDIQAAGRMVFRLRTGSDCKAA